MLEFQELEQERRKKEATRLTKVNYEEMKASAGKKRTHTVCFRISF